MPNGCLQSGCTCPHITSPATSLKDRNLQAGGLLLIQFAGPAKAAGAEGLCIQLEGAVSVVVSVFDSGLRTIRRRGSWRHWPTNRRLPDIRGFTPPPPPPTTGLSVSFPSLSLPLSLSLSLSLSLPLSLCFPVSLHVPPLVQGWHVRSILRWASASGLRPQSEHSAVVSSRGRDDSQAVDDVGEPVAFRGDGQVGKAFC